MERQIGTPLFERVPSGVRPTSSGSALYPHALLVLRMADASGELARCAAPSREHIEIGLPPGLPQAWLLRALREIQARLPQAAVTFTDASSGELLRMVDQGRIDLGVVHQNPPATVYSRALFDQPFGLAVRPSHRLAGRTVCPVRHLDGVRVLAHARDQVPAAHDSILSAAHDAGITPHWRFAKFTENALASAEAAEADAVLLTEPTAARQLPDWPWSRLVEPTVPVHLGDPTTPHPSTRRHHHRADPHTG